jgi:hypothetical protein
MKDFILIIFFFFFNINLREQKSFCDNFKRNYIDRQPKYSKFILKFGIKVSKIYCK